MITIPHLLYLLNNIVWATLKPSNINGIGVFAIRDIPKDTEITDNTIDQEGEFVFSTEGFEELEESIKDLILDRMLYKEDEFTVVINPNCDAILQSFMNHSDNPNTNGRITLRDIKKGEELTESYSIYLSEGHKYTKDNLNKFLHGNTI